MKNYLITSLPIYNIRSAFFLSVSASRDFKSQLNFEWINQEIIATIEEKNIPYLISSGKARRFLYA
jgi:hypothetical protein